MKNISIVSFKCFSSVISSISLDPLAFRNLNGKGYSSEPTLPSVTNDIVIIITYRNGVSAALQGRGKLLTMKLSL